ncbi:MAG: hypothetical protein M0Z75_12010 [Nitrospiraceae bacterium]|nr:hypothetical protein [Nitrospiraceae bacterium]
MDRALIWFRQIPIEFIDRAWGRTHVCARHINGPYHQVRDKAEFHKRLNKAILVSATADPFNVFKDNKDRSLSRSEWETIIRKRIQVQNYDKQETISTIKTQIGQYLFAAVSGSKILFHADRPKLLSAQKKMKFLFLEPKQKS